MSATPSTPLVPRWLLAALVAAALGELSVVALQHERWMVDELPAPRSSERRTKREFEVPLGASAQEELAILRAELAAIERRVEHRVESRRALERLDAQVKAGSYPEGGPELLEQRKERIRLAQEQDDARRAQLLARVAELEVASPAPREP